MEGKIGGIIVALLIACGLVYMQYSNKGNDEQELRDVAHEVLMTISDYDQNESDYDFYFDMHHEQAFEDNYQMGGKRRSASFDEDGYWTQILSAMIETAQADKEPEIIAGLQDLKLRFLADD